jgi:hypothetical protein
MTDGVAGGYVKNHDSFARLAWQTSERTIVQAIVYVVDGCFGPSHCEDVEESSRRVLEFCCGLWKDSLRLQI